MGVELMSVLLFGSALLFMALGLPLVFVLGGVAVAFIYFFWGPAALLTLATRTFDLGTNFVLLAIPLFVFMSNMLMKSGLADDLFNAMYHWIGRMRGGLAIGTVAISAIMAAMVGISAAATIPVGLIALPAMLNRGYDKSLALGCVSAGGALGILIPPSTVMIMLALFAQISVGKLFLGGIFSGLLLAFLFILYIGIRSLIQPKIAPAMPSGMILPLKDRVLMLRSLVLPILLIIGVLGSIFSGAATPTEAAAVGALGSILCTAVYRRLNWQNLLDACLGSLRLSCMIMWLIYAAGSFTTLYTAVGAQELIGRVLLALPGGRWGALIGIQLVLFVLGMLLEPGGIILITTPLFIPLIRTLGFDPLWFGVLFVMNMEMAYLTPPVGFNLFYVKAISPPGVTMADIYRSIAPFVGLQMLGLALVAIFPQIALWLPNTLIH